METLSYDTIIKTSIYVSTSFSFLLPPYLFQLPVANSANTYAEQINEGVSIWAPSHASSGAKTGLRGELTVSRGRHIPVWSVEDPGVTAGITVWVRSPGGTRET